MPFMLYNGDEYHGIAKNENHDVYKWVGGVDCTILFSITQLGNVVSSHFASDKNGLRHIKPAIKEFCEFVFNACEWCEMITANIGFPSVIRIVEKCGFKYLGTVQKLDVYALERGGK